MGEAQFLDEKKVRRAIVDWLGRKGYDRRLREKATEEHGVDISVLHKNYPRYFFVEVKGDANPKTVKHPGSRREVAFLQALGQIITRMKTGASYHYAVGFPSSYSDKIKRRLPWRFCKDNGLSVLLVSPHGKVSEMKWRDLKVFQSSKRPTGLK